MNTFQRGGLLAALTALAAAIAIAIPVTLANVPQAGTPTSAPASEPQQPGTTHGHTSPSERDEGAAADPVPGDPIPPYAAPFDPSPRSPISWRWPDRRPPQQPEPPGSPADPVVPGDPPAGPAQTDPGPDPAPGADPSQDPGAAPDPEATPDPEPTTDPEPDPEATPDPEPTTDPEPDPDPVPTGPATFVSLTFDDGTAGQTGAASILNAHGDDATFFVNSGTIGLPGYLTESDLQALAAAGHEIGGHSVTHPDLATLPADEVARQICDDRSQLLSWGFAVRSFAYPFASTTADVEAAVQACGYNSGRMLGDIESRFGCGGCGHSESIPPGDPYYTRALDQFDDRWTLQDMQDAVTDAETTGGWLQFTFHDICTTSCGELSLPESMLDAFLTWMDTHSATHNTTIATVGDVVGGAVAPAVAGPAVPPPTSGGNGVVNPGLEELAGNSLPSCWFQASYGVGTPAYSLISPGRTGQYASRIEMTGYVDGDAKILPTFDLGACAPSVSTGEQYSLRAWYTSTTVTQFAVYLRTAQGGWVYWTSSPWFASATEYTQAEWTTDPIPPGYTGISFGLNIFSDGVLITDDYGMYDVESAPPLEETLVADPETPPAEASALEAPAEPAEPDGADAVPDQTEVAPDLADDSAVPDAATEEPAAEEPPAAEAPPVDPPAPVPSDPVPAEPPVETPPADEAAVAQRIESALAPAEDPVTPAQ